MWVYFPRVVNPLKMTILKAHGTHAIVSVKGSEVSSKRTFRVTFPSRQWGVFSSPRALQHIISSPVYWFPGALWVRFMVFYCVLL